MSNNADKSFHTKQAKIDRQAEIESFWELQDADNYNVDDLLPPLLTTEEYNDIVRSLDCGRDDYE